jgi:sulfotransferase 6B1
MVTNKHETRPIKPLFLNSIPKSGTNMLIQALVGVPGLLHDPTDTFFDSDEHPINFYRLGQVAVGHFAVGHIYYSDEWSRMLRRLQMKQIFAIRDLRDILVSLSHFIVDKPEYHTMTELREYLLTHASTPTERIRVLIKGIQSDEFHYPDVQTWVTPFLGWLHDSDTYIVKYEDLVSTEASRRKVLTSIVYFLTDGTWDCYTISKAVKGMEESIDPQFSGTFRKGIVGEWKELFRNEDVDAFENIAGSALRAFGYQ